MPISSKDSLRIIYGGGGGGIVFDDVPSFVQPDGSGGWEAATPITTNEDVMVLVPTVSGGVPPYSYEFALYDADDDSVIVARGSGQTVDPGSVEGKTIYARVWAIDAASNEVYADSLPWGPVLAPTYARAFAVGFVNDVSRLDRTTYPAISTDVFWVGHKNDGALSGFDGNIMAAYPTMDAIAVDSTDYGQCGGSGSSAVSLVSGAWPGRSYLVGYKIISDSKATFSMNLPAGKYRGRFALGNAGTTAGTSIRVREGNPVDGYGATIFSASKTKDSSTTIVIPGGDASTSVTLPEYSPVDAEAALAKSATTATDGVLFEVTGSNGITFDRDGSNQALFWTFIIDRLEEE